MNNNQNQLAVIFDMNGVILNDERIHQQAWKKFCNKYNFDLSEEEFKQKIFGRTEEDVFEFLFRRKLQNQQVASYSDERVDIAINLILSSIESTAGLYDFLDQLVTNKIPLGLATSSRKRYLSFVFEKLKLKKYFQVIVTAEDIVHGKPDPEIYLKTAQSLKINPKNCVVFEDSISGIKSAKTAGMKVVGVATTHSAGELNQADYIISDFSGVTVQLITNLNSK